MQKDTPQGKVDILDVLIDNVTMEEALKLVQTFLDEEKTHYICTPNAEIIMVANRDPEFHQILSQSDLVIPDGAGVVLGAKLLGRPLKEKVSGLDLTNKVFERFGAKPGVAQLAASKIKTLYPGTEIVGTQDGYNYNDDELIGRINQSGAQFLIVGLGAPRQENWMYLNRHRLQTRVCIGAGGTIDIFAGTVRKAPEFLRKAGLEWLYRLIRQPSRLKRQLDLPRFVLHILKSRTEEKRR